MNRGKARLLTLIIALLGATVMTGAALIGNSQKPQLKNTPQTLDYSDPSIREDAPDEPMVMSPAPKYKYIVKEHNGFVAVYSSSSSGSPMQVTDTPVSVLPQHDRERLKEGIIVETDEQLAMLLEDLSS